MPARRKTAVKKATTGKSAGRKPTAPRRAATRKPVRGRSAARKTVARARGPARPPARSRATSHGRATAAAMALGRTAGTVSRNIEGALASLRSPATRAAVRERLEKALAETEDVARLAGRKARKNAGKIAAVAGAVAAAAVVVTRRRR